MDLLFWIGVFITSLIILIKSSDVFTENSEKIGTAFKIPPFIIGIAIVSIGTSLPELATSIIAVCKNQTEVVAANAIGSNIANILLIVGISSVVAKKMSVKRSLINLDLPLLACVTMLIILILWDRQVTFTEGLVAISTYLIYVFYLVSSSKERNILSHANREKNKMHNQQRAHYHHHFKVIRYLKKTYKHFSKLEKKVLLMLIISAFFLYLGATYTIESIIKISENINMATSVIAMSAIAFGTSLPELVVSVKAVMKRKYEIALGNIFGSNIFNALIVIGVPSLIANLEVDETTFSIGIPFMAGATILYIFSGISRKIYNWEGMMYLVIYILFLIKIFGIV